MSLWYATLRTIPGVVLGLLVFGLAFYLFVKIMPFSVRKEIEKKP